MLVEPEGRLQVRVHRHESRQIVALAADPDAPRDLVVRARQIVGGKGKLRQLSGVQRVTAAGPRFGQSALCERKEWREARAQVA
jgi:hypothetical protein